MSTVATSRSTNNETMGLRKNVAALTFLRKVTVGKLRSQHIKKVIVSFFSQKRVQLLPKTIAFKSCWLYTAQCNLARYMFSILLKNGIQIQTLESGTKRLRQPADTEIGSNCTVFPSVSYADKFMSFFPNFN